MTQMQSRRIALIAMLAAVEVVILGMGVYVLSGHGLFNWTGRASFAPAPTALRARPIAPVAAGSTPAVYIDDPESRVTVTPSNDGLVHVQDRTHFNGFTWGGNSQHVPPLTVARSADGVRIVRPSYHVGFFGFISNSDQRIDVQVPSGSNVEIARCSGADVTGITNGVSATSIDGSIGITDARGNVHAHSDDGHVAVQRVQGDTFDVSSDDGSLRLTDITANALSARTSDGSIRARGIALNGSAPHATMHSGDGSVRVEGAFPGSGVYEISSNDGRIDLALASGSNATIDAHTGDGSLTLDGQTYDGGNRQSLRVGDGSSTFHVSSGDGSIHVTTNGAL
ncbi:MAG: DUF4097 family beta strand repeat-containing protein [Vulcanimicrobiaceae bacterium]